MNIQPAFVRVTLKCTPGKPPLLKVAVITPTDIRWRTYPNQTSPDEAAIRALRSCNLRAGQCWGWLWAEVEGNCRKQKPKA